MRGILALATLGLALTAGSGCWLTYGVAGWANEAVPRSRAAGVVGDAETGERVLFRLRGCADLTDGWYAFEVPSGWRERPTRASRWGADIREVLEPVTSLVEAGAEVDAGAGAGVKRRVTKLDFPAVVGWQTPAPEAKGASPAAYGVIYVDHTREELGRFAAEVFGFDAARGCWVHLGGVPVDEGAASPRRAGPALLALVPALVGDLFHGIPVLAHAAEYGWDSARAELKPDYMFERHRVIAGINEYRPPAAKEGAEGEEGEEVAQRGAEADGREARLAAVSGARERRALAFALPYARPSPYGMHLKPAVPGLRRMLRNPHLAVRVSAAQSLCFLCPLEAPGLVAGLLREPGFDARMRRRAASFVAGPGSLAPGPRTASPPVGKRFHRRARSIMSAAIAAGVEDELLEDEAIAGGVLALAGSLADEDATVRRCIADALGRFGPLARDAVPGLVEALEDEDDGVLVEAARALGRIGPAAREAVPDLLRAQGEGPAAVRRAAEKALKSIRTEE